MKETFEDYLQRLKDRRTEDNYRYTDEDFIQYEEYIRDCWLTNLSVYKCLEFMYFAEREIKAEDIFNDQKKEGLKEFINKHKQECMITKIMQMDAEMAYDSLPKQDLRKYPLTTDECFKQETLVEAAKNNYKRLYEGEPLTQEVPIDAFKRGYRLAEKQSYEKRLEDFFNEMYS